MPRTSKAMRSARAAMAKLYDELPKMECKGKCQDCCGPIGEATTKWEAMTIVDASVHGGDDAIEAMQTTVSHPCACPLLKMGRCSIYHIRPLICRLWGVVDDPLMRCPFGCAPSQYLTNKQTRAIFDRAVAISKRYYEEAESGRESADIRPNQSGNGSTDTGHPEDSLV